MSVYVSVCVSIHLPVNRMKEYGKYKKLKCAFLCKILPQI